ncbi:MAG: DUF6382 domain-containing protein [Lachnospiraceae bacterium]|nr:DUF6382 domain-containing protein [Lachnospiraceae bacterium]
MKKEMDFITEGNYLITGCDHIGYKLKMLEANRIPGLLPLEIREENDSTKLYYDISSKETFDSVVSSRTLQMDDIRSLIFSLNHLLISLEKYLLDCNDLIPDRNYMYIAKDKMEPLFCYCPGYAGDFSAGLSSLLQDLLGMVDSNDRSAVVSTYALYQASLKKGYRVCDLVNVINNNNVDCIEEKKPEKHEDKKTESKDNVMYKDEILEVVSVSGPKDEKYRTEDDMDDLYDFLNEKSSKYHFGSHRKKSLGFRK